MKLEESLHLQQRRDHVMVDRSRGLIIVTRHESGVIRLPLITLYRSNCSSTYSELQLQAELEGCTDDERQFKKAKRLLTPLLRNGLSAITSLFFVVDRKE